MKWHIIHLACPRIGCANFFFCKVFLDFFAMDVFQPIVSLLDECTCKHSFLVQLNDCLQDAEPRVQNHHETQVEDWGQAYAVTNQLWGPFHLLPFYPTHLVSLCLSMRLMPPHDSTQTTTNRVVFLYQMVKVSLQGTNMNPGHVNWLVHMLMDSSRQFAYPGENC